MYNSPIHDIAATHGISDHGYEDDEQLYISFRPSTDGVPQNSAFSSMSSCISESKLWAANNKLKFNDYKTDAHLITSSFLKTKPTQSALPVGDHLIKTSDAVRNLGLVSLTSRLTLTSSSRARRPSTTYPALLA
ncbi:hypothetical protein DAPPUDRAFT_249770 [Daphnia pulex]|uniref:Uncharacterized protein n=1 Tax=Daphnia pulex TaxID=6669 RepID=E9GXA1_DAPPU|nr:hypothetical protein DAPPUDRAFT_249770 [Daphnia pulex]|eukprot:EFX75836.1 hypothetical protein DAPPUDRAFT_249770 [Daphnia pulex]